jgi:WD repeat-containing protein 19
VNIAESVLDAMDLDTAILAFRQVGDMSKVMALQKIMHIEDCHLRAGHILALSETSAGQAEKLLLAGQDPSAALHLRQDMRQWQKAIELAKVHDASACASLLIQHASMLEIQGDNGNALRSFQVDTLHVVADSSRKL